MATEFKVVRAVFEQALDEFFTRESEALCGDVAERNSCGRLAMYMQRAAEAAGLVEYLADPEYNRKQGGQIKTTMDSDLRVITIIPDVVLHSRGARIEDDNLIVVEMKKSDRPAEEKQTDHIRHRAMTRRSFDGMWSNDGTTHPEHVCGYQLGAYIEVDGRARKARIDYFRFGRRTKTVSRRF